METKSLVEYFYETADRWYRYVTADMCYVGQQISDNSKRKIRNNFNIPIDEEILYFSDHTLFTYWKSGIVITDKSFYVQNSSTPFYKFNWCDFEEVEYKEDCFYFKANGECKDGFTRWHFFQGSSKGRLAGNAFAEVLTEMASMVGFYVNPCLLAENGKYDEAISLSDKLISLYPNDSIHYYVRSLVILKMANRKINEKDDADINENTFKEALSYIEKAENIDGPSSDYHLTKGDIYNVFDELYDARREYIQALEGCDKDDGVEERLNDVEVKLKEDWQKYTDVIEYKDRKFIMPIDDSKIAGCVTDDIEVFRTSNVPPCISFPIGHPLPNQIYMGHPFNKSLYMPIEDSTDLLFEDKVEELCYLMQCLGAVEIEITVIKGKSIDEIANKNTNVSGNVEYKIVSASADINTTNHQQEYSKHHSEWKKSMRFDPLKSPFVPDNLVWFESQPKWSRLVESRLHGNLLEYNESVSTSDINITSEAETVAVKASAKFLWTKAGADVKVNTDSQFRKEEETVWDIKVKFRSLRLFPNAQ